MTEEMAEVAYVSDEGVFDPEKTHWPEHSKNWINAFMPIGRIAVKHVEAELKKYVVENAAVPCDGSTAADWMITRGLIPSPENKEQ